MDGLAADLPLRTVHARRHDGHRQVTADIGTPRTGGARARKPPADVVTQLWVAGPPGRS
jgi:hypothetical protein